MADYIHITFAEPISRERWSEFCKTNGIVFCPQIFGDLTYTAGPALEIELTLHNNSTVQQPLIKGLRLICAAPAVVDKTVQLTRTLADRLNAIVLSFDNAFVAYFGDHAGFSVENDADTLVSEDEQEADVQRTVETVRKEINDAISRAMRFNQVFGAGKLAVEKHVNDVLNAQPLRQFKVDPPREIHYTWKTLYPKLWPRLKAWFAHRILEMPVQLNREPTAFERRLGYKHERAAFYDNSDEFDYDEVYSELTFAKKVGLAIDSGDICIRDTALLECPYTELEMDVYITPQESGRHINMSFEINTDGKFDIR